MMQFMIAITQIVYKLQLHIRFRFTSLKQKNRNTLQSTRLITNKFFINEQKVQFVSILIDLTRFIYLLVYI